MVNPSSTDPTYTRVNTTDAYNPRVKRMVGRAVHGNTPFDVPFISEIEPGFYQGGCEEGLKLPTDIVHVISLYAWERYTQHEDVQTFHEVRMYDSSSMPDEKNVLLLAKIVNLCRADGPTLVHCQAGLNRSGLIVGLALVLEGRTPDEAITHLRESRSPAVLCNRTFETWLRDYKT